MSTEPESEDHTGDDRYVSMPRSIVQFLAPSMVESVAPSMFQSMAQKYDPVCN